MNSEAASEAVRRAVASLAQARERAGLSQYRLAELTGLSREAIRLIESGERAPSLHSFVLLCSALELDPAEVLDRLDP